MERVNTDNLASRLRPPRPARGVITRPRLDGLLDLLRTRLLTVVKAPPGYGKTTAAQSWADALAASGAHVAWLSLSAQEDDDERFFGAVAAALRRACTVDAQAGAQSLLTEAEWSMRELSIPMQYRVEWLAAELAAIPGEIFLVLDDFHEITRPAIHEALSAQLANAPEHLHLIVLGRSEPRLDLAPLRPHDAVLELDAQMLRFDLAETEQLLRKHPSAANGPHDAAALHALTGGWVAALRAAMLTARIRGEAASPGRYAPPGTPRTIQALLDELLEQLPAPLLQFMQRCSVAERVCAPLAACLSGRADAQALLEQIERQQLFITALDDRPHWFAFHRLLRESLLLGAAQHDPQTLPQAHRLAAHWFAEQGSWTEAIGHALAAGETAQAMRWIEDHAMAVVGAGDLLTLLSWERQLRAHLVESPLRLRLAFAWGLGLAMACDKALVLLDGVEAQLAQRDEPTPAELRNECMALRAVVVCTTGDYELAASLADQCTSSAAVQPWVGNARRNVLAASSLHLGHWEQVYVAPPLLGGAQGQSVGDRTASTYRLSIRALAELRQGHLEDAARLLEEAMRVGADSAALAALPAPTLAMVRYLQGRSAEAAQVNAAHMAVNQRVAPIEGLYAAYLVAARLARLDGQAVGARHLLDEGESIGAARGWRRVEATLLLEKVRLCLLDGRGAEADAGSRRIETLARASRSRLEAIDFGRAAQLARAWCALIAGQHGSAVEDLRALSLSAQQDGRLVDRIGLLGALALAQHAAGASSAARRTMLEACVLVQRSGALRALVDQPASMAGLLREMLGARAELARHAWLEPVLARAQRAQVEANESEVAISRPLQSLSPREHHILQLLADGQSNKEIARGLGIAPETVKTHVSKIFTKLGAQNRAQAAAMVPGN